MSETCFTEASDKEEEVGKGDGPKWHKLPIINGNGGKATANGKANKQQLVAELNEKKVAAAGAAGPQVINA